MTIKQQELVNRYDKHVDAVYDHLAALKAVMADPEFPAAQQADFENNVDSCICGDFKALLTIIQDRV